ncbi:hypothetical protein COLO4_08298 [Corchorus olitorius]|uniref:Retrotransposon gag protein n=1 Tax=Corchorus olitorius TaxID=93759 RepID=A0A1R3KGM5_9ROSI|nr:hypothetical protein COLO4_08298 [Corchorus olitorius]
MADGVQTRLQKDVATLQKEVQRIDLSIEQSSKHLSIEFKTSLETTTAEMRQLTLQLTPLQRHKRFMRDKHDLQEQTNTVDEYFEEFEALLSLNDISDEQAHTIFLSNLKDEIEQRARLFFPKTIEHA